MSTHRDGGGVRAWLSFVLTVLAVGYLLVWPLFRPHGIYFGWRYRLPDLYLGTPLLVAAVCMLIVRLTPASRRRPRALRLTTGYLAVFIAVFGLDLAYALVGTTLFRLPHYDIWLYSSGMSSRTNVRDAELGFIRKPGLSWVGESVKGLPATTYRTDENGFRNPAGLRRADVAIVGDSFIEAGTIEEERTAVQQVQRLTGLVTVNLGRTHHGPPQHLIVTKRYALKYQPRAVVWEIFEGNDLTDAEAFVHWTENPASRQTLLQRFASRSLIAQLLPRQPMRAGSRRTFRRTDGTLGEIDLDYLYYPDAPARWARGWEATAKAVQDGQSLCKSQGVEFLVVFVPIKARVLGPFVQFHDDRDRDTWLPGSLMDAPGDFGASMRKECRRLGCDFVDLTDALRRGAETDNTEVYHTVIDTHLDVGGNKILADQITAWLQSKNIVPEKTVVPGTPLPQPR